MTDNDSTHQHAYCGREIVRIRVFVLTSVDGHAALGKRPYEHTYLAIFGIQWIRLQKFELSDEGRIRKVSSRWMQDDASVGALDVS